jgi:hypothetical protein
VTTYRERERARKADWRERNPGMLYSEGHPFAGVDGEGGTTVSGSHDYFLLRAGEQEIHQEHRAINTRECLTFLADLPPTHIYVAYFFDYDVTKILADLSWERVYKLIHRETRMPRLKDGRKANQPFPVDVYNSEFQIDYLPRKEFRVRRPGSKWVVISDVGSFFQRAFAETIETWQIGTVEGREAIAKGKAHRNRFDVSELPQIDKYNHLECRYLAELMDRFRATCKRAGYVPRKWQGPGLIAEEMMRARGIRPSREVPMLSDPRNERLLQFAANSFYGGRPEITMIGWTPPDVFQYDINSAYPWALLHVPCLEHGTWTHRKRAHEVTHGMGLYYGYFEPKDAGAVLYGLPMRRDTGTIYYPAAGSGWYWGFEIQAATHQHFVAVESYQYHNRCDCQPFSWIRDVYEMRVRLGKDTLGLVLKLALNSLYGKIAQSIGSPKYANPIWASFITAFCRTQVQSLVHSGSGHRRGTCGSDIVMVATDAVFATSPLRGVTDSKDLGGYSIDSLPSGMFIVQPGMYYAGGEARKPKTRGVPRNRMEELRPDFIAAFSGMFNAAQNRAEVGLAALMGEDVENPGPVPMASVTVPLKTFVGLRLALHRRKLSMAGTWIGCECLRVTDHTEACTPYQKEISFDPRSKRRMGVTSGRGITTFPHPGSPNTVTVPYSKEIGRWREVARLETVYDQPDWASVLAPEEE